MTEPVALPNLLAAMAQEARDLASDLQHLEDALLPALLPFLAGRGDLASALQRLDPLLQRLSALSRIAAEAAAEAPPQPMPAATACLRAQRLATLLPGLQAPRCSTDGEPVTLFGARP